MTTPTNSKDGTVPNRDLAGHSNPTPPKKRIFGDNPEPRSDTSEQENLRNASNGVPETDH